MKDKAHDLPKHLWGIIPNCRAKLARVLCHRNHAVRTITFCEFGSEKPVSCF